MKKKGIIKFSIYTIIALIITNIVYNFTLNNIIGFPIMFWLCTLYGIFIGISYEHILGGS